MQLNKFISTAFIALSISVTLGMAASNAQESWTVTNTIPAPNNASQELFEAVSATPAPPTSKEIPTTTEGWVTYSEANNAPFVFLTKELATQWDIKIEKAEIAGVPVYWVTPPVIAQRNKNRLFVHTHGGGFSMGYGDAAPYEAMSVAYHAKSRSFQ